jgi:Holliday junction resolvase
MGRKSREKGKRGEREWAKTLQDMGITARRGVQYQGGSASPDVVAELPVHWEVKRSETFHPYDALSQAIEDAEDSGNTPVVVHRKSRKAWIAVLLAADLVKILVELRQSREKDLEKTANLHTDAKA